MPSIKDIYPDKWLRPQHIAGKRPTVAIEKVTVEELYDPRTRQKEPRIVVAFHGKQLRLPLNKTQTLRIAEITRTQDYTRWVGYQIVISVAKAPNGADTIAISPVPDAPTPATPPATNGETARVEQNRAAIAVGVAMGQAAEDDPFEESAEDGA